MDTICFLKIDSIFLQIIQEDLYDYLSTVNSIVPISYRSYCEQSNFIRDSGRFKKRIITEEQLLIRVPADAMQVDPMLVVPFIAMPLVIIMIIIWIVGGKKKSLPANPLDAIYDNKK